MSKGGGGEQGGREQTKPEYNLGTQLGTRGPRQRAARTAEKELESGGASLSFIPEATAGSQQQREGALRGLRVPTQAGARGRALGEA